jgi:hypothetical protein
MTENCQNDLLVTDSRFGRNQQAKKKVKVISFTLINSVHSESRRGRQQVKIHCSDPFKISKPTPVFYVKVRKESWSPAFSSKVFILHLNLRLFLLASLLIAKSTADR